MRKSFIVFLLFFAVLGGTVFFFGWVQYVVPPGAYGVLRSKTGGIDPRVLRNGEFRWAWERLLPTNVSIAMFRPRAVEQALDVSGTLPSADAYADLIGVTGDFTYEVRGNLVFSVKPESLPLLAAEKNVADQAALEVWERRTAEEIGAYAARRLRAYAEESADLELLLGSSASPRLLADIERTFPDVESLSLTIRSIRFPDLALYAAAKSIYEDYLARQRTLWAPQAAETADTNARLRNRLDELGRYGELLTKYPVLLEYLAIEAEKQ